MSLNKKTSAGLSRAKPAASDGVGKPNPTAGNLGKAIAPASSSHGSRLDAKFAAGFGTSGVKAPAATGGKLGERLKNGFSLGLGGKPSLSSGGGSDLSKRLAGGFGLQDAGYGGYSGTFGGIGTLGMDNYSGDTEGRPAFQDVITGGIFDILQETKPVGYDSRAEAFNRIKGDAFGIADEFRSNKSMIEKTDAALQRISRIADGIRAMETTTLEQKLGDLSYGIFHGFYERVQKKWGKKLEKANDFLNRLGSIGRSFMNIFGIKDNAIITGSKAGPAKVFKAMDVEYVSSIAGKDLFSTGMYFGEYARFMMEDLGYLYDPIKSIMFSRDYAFIHRPFMEGDTTGRIKTYVFFTRPNLNIFVTGDNGEIAATGELARYDTLRQLVLSDPGLYSELCRDGCNKTALFTFLNNYCLEVPAIRMNESSRDGVRNMHGGTIPLPGKPENVGVDISVTFTDNNRADIAKLLFAMRKYSHYVAEEGYPMRPEYIKNQALDSYMSMYVFTVDTNWDIITMGVGFMLTLNDTPTHMTQHKMEGFEKPELLDSFTVSFKALEWDAHAPEYYDYFNWISNFNPANVVDTRGSALTLQEITRDNQTGRAGCPYRTSVWTEDCGFKGGYMSGPAVAPSFTNKPIIAQTFPRVFEYVNYMHRGVGELIARNPGVYVAINSNEPNRRIFKLGFSY